MNRSEGIEPRLLLLSSLHENHQELASKHNSITSKFSKYIIFRIICFKETKIKISNTGNSFEFLYL